MVGNGYVSDRNKQGRPHGNGRYTFDSGGTYEGDWEEGKRQGLGKIIYPSGEWRKGQWNNDQLDGFVEAIYSNGNRFEGEFRKGCFHSGTLKTIGSTYEGGFDCEGNCHGKGKMTFKDGTIIECKWEHGKAIGMGTEKTVEGGIQRFEDIAPVVKYHRLGNSE